MEEIKIMIQAFFSIYLWPLIRLILMAIGVGVLGIIAGIIERKLERRMKE